MTITFLGTAAANAYPEAFCQCDNCERARALGGANLRKRSAALINDDLLENDARRLRVAAGRVRLRLRPHELVTVRLVPGR